VSSPLRITRLILVLNNRCMTTKNLAQTKKSSIRSDLLGAHKVIPYVQQENARLRSHLLGAHKVILYVLSK